MRRAAFLAAIITSAAATAGTRPLADCAAVADDSARLSCYDKLAGRETNVPAPQEQPALITETPVVATAGDDTLSDDGNGGFISPRLEEEKENANNRFVIIPHQRNYLLPVTYNSNINEEAWKIAYPGTGMDQAEVKFQISMKASVFLQEARICEVKEYAVRYPTFIL